MKRLQIIFIGLFVVLFVAIFSMLIFGYVSLRRTLPQIEGSITLRTLEDTVTVHRDTYGIPHVFADNERDDV